MSEWSQKTAAKLRSRSERQHVLDAKFVEERRIKREMGPRAWSAVKSDVGAEASALNTEMGEEIVVLEADSNTELVLRAHVENDVRRLHVYFNPESGQLKWSAETGLTGDFEFAVGLDGKPAFHSKMAGTAPSGTGSIARQILDSLLRLS